MISRTTVASIILKWKKPGATLSLSRVGCPATLKGKNKANGLQEFSEEMERENLLNGQPSVHMHLI